MAATVEAHSYSLAEDRLFCMADAFAFDGPMRLPYKLAKRESIGRWCRYDLPLSGPQLCSGLESGRVGAGGNLLSRQPFPGFSTHRKHEAADE